MKNYIFIFTIFFTTLFFINHASASTFSQSITLYSGWNIISTPRLVESHYFSAPETSDNFDIYILNPASASKWSTMAELNQTEFTPLYGYFINNKTGTNQTLTFNYKQNVNPNERLFSREFSKIGWYSIGVANPTYAKTQYSDAPDANNPSNILFSIKQKISSAIDFTYGNSNIFSVAVSSTWKGVNADDLNSLNDFRETKGYAIFINNTDNALYEGFQNNDPVSNDDIDQATLSLAKDASSPKAGILVSDSTGKVEKGTMLVLALSAEKGRVKVTDITATTSGGATFSALYLYDGSTLLSSASVSSNSATFSDLEVYVEKDQTKLLTIKADFTGATSSTFATGTVQVLTSNITAEKADGTSLTVSGSTATSDTMRVTALAPVITLKSFTASWSRNAQESTGTLAGTLEVDITAKGGDIYISKTAGNSFAIVKVPSSGSTSTVASTYYDTTPTNVTEMTNTYKIAKNQTATFKIKTTDTFAYDGKNYYLKTAVGDGSKIDWASSDSSSMDGIDIDFFDASTWKTGTVTVN